MLTALAEQPVVEVQPHLRTTVKPAVLPLVAAEFLIQVRSSALSQFLRIDALCVDAFRARDLGQRANAVIRRHGQHIAAAAHAGIEMCH